MGIEIKLLETDRIVDYVVESADYPYGSVSKIVTVDEKLLHEFTDTQKKYDELVAKMQEIFDKA